MVNDLALLLATDATTYGNYVRSVIVMKVEAEVTKALITATGWEFRRKLKQEIKARERKKGVQK